MEPGLHALFVAEGQAAEIIARARIKRKQLLQQSIQESQNEMNYLAQHEIVH